MRTRCSRSCAEACPKFGPFRMCHPNFGPPVRAPRDRVRPCAWHAPCSAGGAHDEHDATAAHAAAHAQPDDRASDARNLPPPLRHGAPRARVRARHPRPHRRPRPRSRSRAARNRSPAMEADQFRRATHPRNAEREKNRPHQAIRRPPHAPKEDRAELGGVRLPEHATVGARHGAEHSARPQPKIARATCSSSPQ